MSLELGRFAEVDYSSAYNDFGGYNVPNIPNYSAFAALKADGSITAWGDSSRGGTGAPSNGVYTKIYSTEDAFAALKADGSITAWGFGSADAPSDSGYTKIYSTSNAFVAIKADGSITAWGYSGAGGRAHLCLHYPDYPTL
jgi:alpha-tubulin suppressor-like RCC1 family protein